MCFEWSSTSKGITKPIFCIKYGSNQEKFAEMALWKIHVKSIYLDCTTKGCKARLTIQIRPPILVEVVDGKNLASSVTEKILLSTTNYGPIKHVRISQLKRMMVHVVCPGHCAKIRIDERRDKISQFTFTFQNSGTI